MGSTSATDHEDEDPLKHADLGTTRTLRESKTLNSINLVPDEFFGSDRFPDHIDIVDVELVETEDMSCGPDIKITWEGDVTKSLPYRWDYHAEPITPEEEKRARRSKWAKRLVTPAITLGTLAFSLFSGLWVMNRVAGQMTINGEAVTAPTVGQMLPAVIVILLISVVIMWAITGRFPRRVGR